VGAKHLGREVRLAVGALGCAFTPPPRFVFVGPSPDGDIGTWYEFHRLSFSGTDGIDRLLVIETKERLKVDDPDGLSKRAVALSRKIHIEADVPDVECRADSVAEINGRPNICVIAEGQGIPPSCEVRASVHYRRRGHRDRSFADCGGRLPARHDVYSLVTPDFHATNTPPWRKMRSCRVDSRGDGEQRKPR
jgi:hypothetical protein